MRLLKLSIERHAYGGKEGAHFPAKQPHTLCFL